MLRPDGSLIAQSDSPPASYARPTTTWVEGEIIHDTHTIELSPALSYLGPVTVAVGLYDSQTITRLPLAAGGDAFTLPVQVQIR